MLAGERALALVAEIARGGETAVSLLTGAGRGAGTGIGAVEPFRHYPDGDVYDFASHAQFYYHTHRAGEHGHIHLFQRPKGMPRGIAPAFPPPEPDSPCHLVAIGFDRTGLPVELFTTNRWVTGEAWYVAAAVKAMLPGFKVAATGPRAKVAQLLTLLVELYRPAIAELIDARDAAVAAWSLAHPDINPLEDPALEITSRMAIDL